MRTLLNNQNLNKMLVLYNEPTDALWFMLFDSTNKTIDINNPRISYNYDFTSDPDGFITLDNFSQKFGIDFMAKMISYIQNRFSYHSEEFVYGNFNFFYDKKILKVGITSDGYSGALVLCNDLADNGFLTYIYAMADQLRKFFAELMKHLLDKSKQFRTENLEYV